MLTCTAFQDTHINLRISDKQKNQHLLLCVHNKNVRTQYRKKPERNGGQK